MHRSRKLLGVRSSDWYQNQATFLYFHLVTFVCCVENYSFHTFANGVPVPWKKRTFSVCHDKHDQYWVFQPSEPDIFVIGSQDFIFSSLGVQVGVCRKRCRVVLKFGISPFFIEISDDSHPAGRFCRLV